MRSGSAKAFYIDARGVEQRIRPSPGDRQIEEYLRLPPEWDTIWARAAVRDEDANRAHREGKAMSW